MIALLDGDIYAYRVGWTTEDVDINIAKWRLDEMVSNTLDEVGADGFKIFLTDGEGNFRRKIYPEYHVKRVKPPPRWLEELKEHLIVKWNASISFGQEADDALGIHQVGDSIICSIDKDLLQIPGHHFNFVKKEWAYILKSEGTKWFYTQLLIGDPIDEIKGVEGIGKAKAAKILENAGTEEEIFDAVRASYEKRYGECGLTLMLLYGKLLKIRTKVNEEWSFPKLDIQLQ